MISVSDFRKFLIFFLAIVFQYILIIISDVFDGKALLMFSGTVVILMGIWALQGWRILKNWEKGTAVCIDNIRHDAKSVDKHGNRGLPHWQPVYRLDHGEMSVEWNGSVDPRRVKLRSIGSKLQILFDPSDISRKFTVSQIFSRYFMPLTISLVVFWVTLILFLGN